VSNFDSDSDGTLALGGGILLMFLGSLFFKWMTGLFNELGIAFVAFATMTESFISMAWHLFEIVAFISGAIGLIYFTFKFFKMIDRATEIEKSVREMLTEFEKEIEVSIISTTRALIEKVDDLDLRLNEALKRPELVPEQVVESQLSLPAPSAAQPAESAAEPIIMSNPL